MKEQLLLNDFSQLLNMPINMINKSIDLSKHAYWDSISVISIIGAIDSHYAVTVSGEELMKAIYVQDVFDMIDNKLRDIS